jgi:hypothetical protein
MCSIITRFACIWIGIFIGLACYDYLNYNYDLANMRRSFVIARCFRNNNSTLEGSAMCLNDTSMLQEKDIFACDIKDWYRMSNDITTCRGYPEMWICPLTKAKARATAAAESNDTTDCYQYKNPIRFINKMNDKSNNSMNCLITIVPLRHIMPFIDSIVILSDTSMKNCSL